MFGPGVLGKSITDFEPSEVESGTYKKYSDGSYEFEPMITISTVPSDTSILISVESDTDRFLAQVIQPLLDQADYGDDPQLGSLEMDQVNATCAVAKYLRALVLIEQEKLRRDAR